jgi:hypothetical protein
MVSVNSGYEEYDLVTHALLDRVNMGNLSVRGAGAPARRQHGAGVGEQKLRIVTPSGHDRRHRMYPTGTGTDTLPSAQPRSGDGYFYFGRGLDMFAVTSSCQQQWTAKFANTASKAYDVAPRAGGGAWATTGDPSTVVEVNTAGQILSQVGGENVHTGLLDLLLGFRSRRREHHRGQLVGTRRHASSRWTAPRRIQSGERVGLALGHQTEALQITNALFVR